jgi:hypothetical protein
MAYESRIDFSGFLHSLKATTDARVTWLWMLMAMLNVSRILTPTFHHYLLYSWPLMTG